MVAGIKTIFSLQTRDKHGNKRENLVENHLKLFLNQKIQQKQIIVFIKQIQIMVNI
jgi:hypothetical protein